MACGHLRVRPHRAAPGGGRLSPVAPDAANDTDRLDVVLHLGGMPEPFAVDRHDLVGFRIAGLSAPTAGADVVVPEVALIAAGRPYTETRAALRWYWLDAPDELFAAEVATPVVAEGPVPTLEPPEDGLLGLTASYEGAEARAVLTTDRDRSALPTWSGVALAGGAAHLGALGGSGAHARGARSARAGTRQRGCR